MSTNAVVPPRHTSTDPSRGSGSRPALPTAPLAWVGLAVAAAAYVALRFAMTREFPEADWKSLVDLRAPLPYGHRLLVPLVARAGRLVGVPVPVAFAIVEWAATVGLVVALRRVFACVVPRRPAALGAVAILLVLPLSYLLQHRWPIFYPWDTPGMLVIALGLWAGLADRPRAALVIVTLGALNRETAVLVPACFVLLRPGDAQRWRKTLAWAGLMLVAFVVVRQAIAIALPDNPGEAIRLHVDGDLRLASNLAWLADGRNALAFLGALACLPVAWVVLFSAIPLPLRRLHVLALAVTGGLLVVANAYEPRAFGAVIVLAYVPVAVGVWRWATEQDASVSPSPSPWVAAFDRYGGAAVVAVWVVVAFVLVRTVSPP